MFSNQSLAEIIGLNIAHYGLQLPEGMISKHFTVNQAQTLIEAQSLI